MTQQNHQHKPVLGLFGSFRRQFWQIKWAFPLILIALFGSTMVGCGSDQPRGEARDQADTKYYTDQSHSVFSPEPSQARSGSDAGIEPRAHLGRWTIMLVRIQRANAQVAGQMLQVVINDAGIEGAYLDHRSDGTMIAYGEYIDKSDPQAIKDLNRIRSIQVEGERIFEQAILVPPTSESLRGSNASYDLRGVKKRFGDRAIYTLQVGIYGRTDYQQSTSEELAAYRQAAEQAVRELRADGVMAFYYHAPARSMVTIGVFGARDFDASTLPPTQSNELRELREEYPYNLLNGQGIEETVRTDSGKTTRIQSSQLVNIPKK